MAKLSKNQALIPIAATLFLISCANIIPPSGGPIDDIPPFVVDTYPKNYALNFKDNIIYFDFSEFMDQQSTINSIYFSPKVDDYSIKLTGKRLKILLNKQLSDSTTYTITLSNEASDFNNKNKMSEPYQLVFSTGDKILANSISGKIFGLSLTNVFVYAYKNISNLSDLFVKEPDYFSFASTSGNFTLSGLSEGEYVIAAVKKNSKDNYININHDEIGVFWNKVNLIGSNSRVEEINIMLRSIDSIAPMIKRAVFADSNIVRVIFNESIGSNAKDLKSFLIFNDDKSAQISPLFSYYSDAERKEAEFYFEKISDFTNAKIFVEEIEDLNNNIAKNISSFVEPLHGGEKRTIKLTDYILTKSNYLGIGDNEIEIKFNDPIISDSILASTKILSYSKLYKNYKIKTIDDSGFKIIFNNTEELSEEIKVLIDLKNLAYRKKNLKDTVCELKIKVENRLLATGISGEIIFENILESDINLNDAILVLSSEKADGSIYKQFRLDGGRYFKFENIKPGEYYFWIYEDCNKNYKYDFGNPFKNEFPEKFYYSAEAVKIPPRWSIKEAKVKF